MLDVIPPNWEGAMDGAAYGGHRDLVRFFKAKM